MNIFRKTYTAAVDIPAYSLVKFGTDDNIVTLATSAADDVIGVSGDVDVTAGNLIDIAHLGVEKVKCGGAITRGQAFYAGTNGQAVTAESGNIAGYVLRSASKNDVVLAVINRAVMPAATTPEETTPAGGAG